MTVKAVQLNYAKLAAAMHLILLQPFIRIFAPLLVQLRTGLT